MTTVTPPEVVRIREVTVIRPGADFASLYGQMMDHLEPSLKLADSVNPPRLIIDLRHVKFIGSAFLGTIVKVQKTVAKRPSGRFALCELSSFSKAAVAVTKLDTLLEIFDTLDDALEAFAKHE